jgi:hypothetical protein
VDELLHGVIVQSGNDATIALVEGLAGSEESFVQRMNDQAMRLGMTHTHFANATGLGDPHHYSTVGDLSLLTVALIRDFPEYFPMYAVKEYTYNGITQRNPRAAVPRSIRRWGQDRIHRAAGYCRSLPRSATGDGCSRWSGDGLEAARDGLRSCSTTAVHRQLKLCSGRDGARSRLEGEEVASRLAGCLRVVPGPAHLLKAEIKPAAMIAPVSHRSSTWAQCGCASTRQNHGISVVALGASVWPISSCVHGTACA